MPEIHYTLTIRYPDVIDADTLAEIELDAEPHDTTPEARVGRWLGGAVDDAASQLSAWLPIGWRASVVQHD